MRSVFVAAALMAASCGELVVDIGEHYPQQSVPAVGGLGQACYPNATCNDQLACDDGTCTSGCTFGADQTCNDILIMSSFAGTCGEDGLCTCRDDMEVNPATGKCRPPLVCTVGQDQTCNDDPSVNAPLGLCDSFGQCECYHGMNPDTEKCVCPQLNDACPAYAHDGMGQFCVGTALYTCSLACWAGCGCDERVEPVFSCPAECIDNMDGNASCQPTNVCTSHSQCDPALFCNSVSGNCVECLNSDHCPLSTVCSSSGFCDSVVCASGSECASGICLPSDYCLAGSPASTTRRA